MKNLFLVTISLLFTSSLFSQIGISAVYSSIGTSGWDDVKNVEAVEDFEGGFTYGIDYWFRLKDYRVEFLPELSYGSFNNEIDNPSLATQNLSADLDIYAVSFNTQIYLFDLDGDCDCPTWGKDGDVFKKGFFFMVGPGLSHFRHDDIVFREPFENPELIESSTTRFTVAAGFGLDIGITKSLTITPFGRFKWHSSGSWEALETLATLNGNQDDFEDFDSTLTQLQGGLRLSYRWGQ